MNLQRTILSFITNKELKKIIEVLGIQNVDKRKNDVMRKSILRSRKADVEYLLNSINEKKVKYVCNEVGITSVGRKQALIDKLLRSKKKPSFIKAKKKRGKQKKSDVFVAIDFETADRSRDSACSVALVRVESGNIVHQEHRLIRPPRKNFEFSYLHGITWDLVASEPRFRHVWLSLEHILDGVDFFAAHNASFDRSVLNACCQASGIRPLSIPFQCTVALARKTWGIYPTKLPNVCRYLTIPLIHHEALSDAVACAKIVIAASKF